MTLFEYLSVAISVVLALSAGRILANLQLVFHPQRRYWVHAAWVVLILYFHISAWWRYWAFRDLESWNLGVFILLLVGPGLLFVCSNALVLSHSSDETSWEQHFFSVRAWFFVVLGVLVVVATLRSYFLLGIPLLDWSRSYGVLLLLVCVGGVLSESRRVHSALVLLSLLGTTLATAYVWFEPGVLGLSQ